MILETLLKIRPSTDLMIALLEMTWDRKFDPVVTRGIGRSGHVVGAVKWMGDPVVPRIIKHPISLSYYALESGPLIWFERDTGGWVDAGPLKSRCGTGI